MLLVVAALTAGVLVVAARSQMYDTNFYLLWEATCLLLGDHPYRELFEWGAPLGAYVSAAAQLVSGHRLIGEFATQWSFIIAGVVMSSHLALRITRSARAVFAVLPITLVVVGATPTYHYSKLFFFPLTILLAWRYLDRPSAWRSAAMGAASAVAFLFRHDYGIYTGFASAAAIALGRAAVPTSTRPRPLWREAGGYLSAVATVLAPWIVTVSGNERVFEYVTLRAALYERPARALVYSSLFTWNPAAAIDTWMRAPLSQAVAARAVAWLAHITLLIPLLLLVLAARRSWRSCAAAPLETRQIVVAAAFLVVVNSALLREFEYFVAVFPATAALGACFFVVPARTVRAVAIGVLLLTGMAAGVWARESLLFHPSEVRLEPAFTQLLASPPTPADSNGAPSPRLQYVRDCSRSGDRLIVTGSTPYHINYYARRSIAGGHIYWRLGWRADPAHEWQSLQLLQHQSVPFAISSDGPVLEDFAKYPRIREYLVKNYEELPGTGGRLLVDRRRRPTGMFEPLGFPCFR